MVILQSRAVHALLYLIVSFLAVAVIFFAMGSPFVAALEVIIYAGAILILFVFAIMMLNLSPGTAERERRWFRRGARLGPILLGSILVGELIYVALGGAGSRISAETVGPAHVGIELFGPYKLGVEMASMLLLAGLVGACHLARRHDSAGGRRVSK